MTRINKSTGNNPNLGHFKGSTIWNPMEDVVEMRRNGASEKEIEQYIIELGNAARANLIAQAAYGEAKRGTLDD